jgi:hypothetical protein
LELFCTACVSNVRKNAQNKLIFFLPGGKKEVTERDQTESDQARHYGIMESDKALFRMR